MARYANPENILITGATSGIGRALAQAYARPGHHLLLGGRDAARLATVAAEVRAAGATCDLQTIDVREQDDMAAWIAAVDDRTPLDLVIANAGISAGTRKKDTAANWSDADIFATNVDGVVHTVAPALARMEVRKQGQIAIMSSLAGFRAFRDAPAYCASKAAIRFYGAGLRRHYARHNIGVSVVCSGFVRSPMTDANDFRMPFLVEAEDAARLIHRRLARNPAMIAFPLPMYLAVRMLALF
jgi:NADP-dependent 3-hydroxy acid dehydrogenase YdfG